MSYFYILTSDFIGLQDHCSEKKIQITTETVPPPKKTTACSVENVKQRA